MATAAAVIRWLETLLITEGPLAGKKFKVAPFQEEFVRGFMRNVESGLSVGRGNGKTALAGGLGACAIAGPLMRPRGQVILMASAFGQAKIAGAHAEWFLRERLDFEERIKIRGRSVKRWRVVDNHHEFKIEDMKTGAHLRTLGCDPKRSHGLAPVLVIADEPAQWPTNFGPKMYAALVTALGKQVGGKFLAIGTRPDDPNHWFELMLKGGPGVYGQVHAADKYADSFSHESIWAANPLLSQLPLLQEEIMREKEKALAGGAHLAMWRAFRLNQGTSEMGEHKVIVSVDNWQGCVFNTLPPREGPVAIGFDLGGSASMTAFVAYWPKTGRLEVRGAFPADPGLAARGLADSVDDRYVRMAERGEIRTYPGKVTPVGRFLVDRARQVEGQEVIAAAADRYRQAEAEQALNEADIHWKMEWRATGAGKDGSADIRAFQVEVLEAHLRTTPSLLMESAIAECVIGRDANGNPRLDKERRKGRIDALQAAVLAVGLGRRWRLPSMEEDDLAKYYMSDEETGAWSA